MTSNVYSTPFFTQLQVFQSCYNSWHFPVLPEHSAVCSSLRCSLQGPSSHIFRLSGSSKDPTQRFPLCWRVLLQHHLCPSSSDSALELPPSAHITCLTGYLPVPESPLHINHSSLAPCLIIPGSSSASALLWLCLQASFFVVLFLFFLNFGLSEVCNRCLCCRRLGLC